MRVLDAFDRLTPQDRMGSATDAHVAVGLDIAEALRAAPDIGTAVLQVLIADDRRRGSSGSFRFVVPESLQPPSGTADRLLTGYSDAASLYQTVARAGDDGFPLRLLGRDLDGSRRNAALRRLRSSDAVSESRVANPGQYPPHLVWLHATAVTYAA